MAGRPPDGTPLYVHLPFCAAKCHYCDFFSVPAEGQDVDGMVAAVLEEARLRAPRRPRTVFLGGGTPSLLSIPQLQRLLDELQRLTGFRDSALEVTAECNPESLDEDKASALLDLGVDRLSIGVQSLDGAVLELFGRVHGPDDGLRALEAARRAGARRANVDLIFGVQGQTEAGWRAELERVLDHGPDHVAAYGLTFEPGTVFMRWLDEGRVSRCPEALEVDLLLATREVCARRGFEGYEVSNFAAPGQRCLHNVNYWKNGSYVGIGPSAASFVGGERRGNVRSIQGYLRRLREGREAVDWTERLDARARLGETWWLGLRLAEGIDPDEARASAGFHADSTRRDPAEATAEWLVAEGLLELREGRYRTTERGLCLADAVAREFLELDPRAATGDVA